MLTVLSTLTSVEEFLLEFQSPQSLPDWAGRRPPPLTLSVLPLFYILEELVARIDAPRLNKLNITFFNQILFDTPQSIQIISRTPMLKALEKAWFNFGDGIARVNLSSQASDYGEAGELHVGISCRALDWQVLSLEQVCTSCLPPLSTLDILYISEHPNLPLDLQNTIGNSFCL